MRIKHNTIVLLEKRNYNDRLIYHIDTNGNEVRNNDLIEFKQKDSDYIYSGVIHRNMDGWEISFENELSGKLSVIGIKSPKQNKQYRHNPM